MELLIAYIVFILVGPVIFLGLIRPAPTRSRFAMGVASATGLLVAAYAMRVWGPDGAAVAVVWLACLWLGWITTIATAVQAWALVRGFGRQRKWSAAMGAAAVTLPWFGLSLTMTAG
ncbi:hypothetical protein [Marimonas arenosa]|uniref:Uncharacterized protein n=1 Tax=Marimonas arenosa TaxID=1795305 RepID=A0AAE3WD78_9RHOB|nr:hypothetical protein [Marimonas arenosa]MDQ2090479.1 hypothetical protein [Marimonas arenosa]